MAYDFWTRQSLDPTKKKDALWSSRTIGAYNTESDPNPKSDKKTISFND